MRSLFGGQQNFSDPWVRAASFNRLGGHLSRMLVSQAAASLRIARARKGSPEDAVRTLERDGVALIEDFVDTESHRALRDGRGRWRVFGALAWKLRRSSQALRSQSGAGDRFLRAEGQGA